MKQALKLLFLLTLSFFFFSNDLISQEYKCSEEDGKKLLKIAREIIDSSRYCALISLDDNGIPQARPMDPFKPDNNFIIRFGTNSNSRKVDQIKKNPVVALYYLSKDAKSYVTVTGTAKLVSDEDAKKKWWKDEWKDFYPDKKNGYMIIEVSPKQLELISETKGIYGNKETWKAPVVVFDHK